MAEGRRWARWLVTQEPWIEVAKIMRFMTEQVFSCRMCGAQVFLYRGVCVSCAPELHAIYHEARESWNARFEAFEAETGKDILCHWYAFEQWCEARLPRSQGS